MHEALTVRFPLRGVCVSKRRLSPGCARKPSTHSCRNRRKPMSLTRQRFRSMVVAVPLPAAGAGQDAGVADCKVVAARGDASGRRIGRCRQNAGQQDHGRLHHGDAARGEGTADHRRKPRRMSCRQERRRKRRREKPHQLSFAALPGLANGGWGAVLTSPAGQPISHSLVGGAPTQNPRRKLIYIWVLEALNRVSRNNSPQPTARTSRNVLPN